MNKEFLNTIQVELGEALKTEYQYDNSKISVLSEAGKSSIIGSLKQFVLKKGTSEIEDILLDKRTFNGSDLRKFALDNLTKDFSGNMVLKNDPLEEIAGFSINFIIGRFKDKFQESGNSKDLDGICKFLGIDKNLLGLVNSPVAKMFGKFF